jgi:predicted XRE-type DNA-binding protein
MRKRKQIVTRTAAELADVLGLSRADGMELEVRQELNEKIIDIVSRRALTHAQVAKLARTSRTRVTALLNRNTADISTDLMLRVLASLGYRVSLRFSRSSAEADRSP